jgi:hypothetical protein
MVAADVAETVNAAGVPTTGVVGLTMVKDATDALGIASPVVALEGKAETIPKPREATATSATRLKVVFVDICFLSISRDRESPVLGFG